MKAKFSLHPITEQVLQIGLLLLLLTLVRLLFELLLTPALSFAAAARYSAIAEYILTSLTLLTGATYLIERVLRAGAQS